MFDAALLVGVLGKIPNTQGALRELHRVLMPSGRLVVGEALPDPHMVGFGSLTEHAEAAGMKFERRLGGPLGYSARFRLHG